MKISLKNISAIITLAIFFLFTNGCSKSKDLAVSTPKNGTIGRSLITSTDYYWYKGKQILLVKNPNRKFLLFEGNNESMVSNLLTKKNVKIIKKSKDYILSKSINGYNEKLEKSLKWSVIESSVSL